MNSKLIFGTALASVMAFGPSAVTAADKMAAKAEVEVSAEWKGYRESAVSVDSLLSGDVLNVNLVVGEIKDIILSEDQQKLEYVLYRVPNRYQAGDAETGFLVFATGEVHRDVNSGTDIRLIGEESKKAPDTLTLTRGDVQDRRASAIIGSELTFSDGRSREISDILVDPKSGNITHFVVEMNADALFDTEPRAVPANRVLNAENGYRFTTLTKAEIELLPEM